MDNYFNRYLTDRCAKCADWRDGSNGKENGCFAEVSMNCPYLAEKIKAEKEAIMNDLRELSKDKAEMHVLLG